MWDETKLMEFYTCVYDLLSDKQVQSMHAISQHAEGIDCFDHSLFVAYVSFCLCRRWGLDAVAAARAGLLHDLYLCNWADTDVGLFRRLVVHPMMALGNARRFGLSELEEDIIRTHMWPVTLRALPRHRESWVVSLADKLCTLSEISPVYRMAQVHTRLRPAFAGRRNF